VERSVPLKALVSQVNYSMFDLEVGQQQSQFAYLQAKDLADAVDGLMRTHDKALWNGTDTSLTTPTTVQYYGAASQIANGGNVATIATTDSIVDGLKSTIAQMVSNSSYEVRPTAIYANPVLLDLIDREMKTEFNVVLASTEVAGGLTVKTLSTQAGDLPLIPEWTLGYTGTPGSGTAVLPAYAAQMQCAISFTRLMRGVSAEVRSTPLGGSTKTRLLGTIAEGAECLITTQPQLQFFASSVPASNESIVVSFRSRGRALARVIDTASVAAYGERKAMKRVLQPACRTSIDCENAALALLDDSTQAARAGEYSCWSDFLPGGAASDPLPGDAVHVVAPSRELDFTATLREVEVEVTHLDDDRSLYKLRFANDAAEPLAVAFDEGLLREELDAVVPGASFIADLSNAQLTAISSVSVTLDTGVAAPSGGGFEVRRSDFAWGAGNDRNLIGRFTSQSFTVPRLARVQTFYVKQYDAAGKYSRYASVLHVEYPL
jgi:hypothetical protein